MFIIFLAAIDGFFNKLKRNGDKTQNADKKGKKINVYGII